MKIMLTGACGSVGMEVLQALLEDDHKITVYELKTKTNQKKMTPYLDRVSLVWGDIVDLDQVKDVVHDQDVIIHLAAIIPPQADEYPELARSVNYQGTLNIIEAIKECDDMPVLLFASSISVYGDRTLDPWIRVDDVLKPSVGDYYAVLKIMSEEAIKEAKIPYVIFRLTGIMSYPKIDPLMFHMPLSTKLEFATAKDVGFAYAEALKHLDELMNKTYNLGGGEGFRIDYKAFLWAMFKIYGLNPKHLRSTSFAQKNFHCGYYADTAILNDILHFQRDDLTSYYQRLALQTPLMIKVINKVFSKLILEIMQKRSEPYLARLNNDLQGIERFFINK